MTQFQPPLGKPEQPQIGTMPEMPAVRLSQPTWYPSPLQQQYYRQPYQPPFPPQGYLPGPATPSFWQQPYRPVRQNIKIASIVCFIVASVLIYAAGLQALVLVELLNFAGFILIFCI